jgi:tetratricopeptide (TPR) repeat protein
MRWRPAGPDVPESSGHVVSTPLPEPTDPPMKPGPINDQAPPGQSGAPASTAETVGSRSPRSIALLGAAVIVGLLMVLGVVPLSELVGSRPGRPAGLSVEVSSSTGVPPADSGLRDVPRGLPRGTVIRTADDVLPFAVRALGPAGADAMLAVLASGGSLLVDQVTAEDGSPLYPYRYPAVESVLDGAASGSLASDGTALGAALTLLAAQTQPQHEEATAIDNAGPAAFAVLLRARAQGGCAPQVNLLLLLASDDFTGADVLASELERAEAACPGDLAPGWLVAQAQLRGVSAGTEPERPGSPTSDAVTTMERVVTRHATSTAALTGLGDAYLGAAMTLDEPPFTARRFFREAVAAYNRAVDRGGQRDAAAGLARALIGLGEPSRAVDLLSPLAQSDTTPGPVLEVLIAAQESAHRFRDAENIGRRLAALGPSAYPRGGALFPNPQMPHVDTVQDVSNALSLGADHLGPLRASLAPQGARGSGGDALDISFIPQYRDVPGVTGTHAACASWAWRRDAVVAGRGATALETWTTAATGARPDGFGCPPEDDPARLQVVAELLDGGDTALADPSSDGAADDWQNLLRWAGDLPAARHFVVLWDEARADTSELPARRLGEIDFLTHRYDDAASEFDVAARRTRLLRWNGDLAVGQVQLARSASLLAAGRAGEAEAILRSLSAVGIQGYAYHQSQVSTVLDDSADDEYQVANEFAVLSYHASGQLADEERRTGRLRAAVEDYEAALSWLSQFADPFNLGARREALYNNAALAYLGLGNTAQASDLVDQALHDDPQSPIFLMTAGFVADRRGDVPGAMRRDRQALENDPGLYPAANDLGVELARLDRPTEARSAFRQAVGARPDYALGWFNLGVLESSRGFTRLLAAQHALATAYRLDPALRDRHLELTIDARVYRTALDLSKPLPPAWTLADLQRPAPAAAVGLLAVVGLGLGLARTANRGAAQTADKWLDPMTRRLEALPVLGRARAPVWAVIATVAAFLLADLHRSTTVTATVLYPVGLLVLAATAVSARDMVARRTGTVAPQRSWAPGIVVAVATGAAGYPWAPLPVVDTGEKGLRVHLAAPLTLAAVALVLFVESTWTRAPLAQAWAVATLIMCASLLLPVGPLDGAHLGKAGVAASAGVVGAALLLAVGLL